MEMYYVCMSVYMYSMYVCMHAYNVVLCTYVCMFLRLALSFEISSTDGDIPLLGEDSLTFERVRLPCPVGESICRRDPQLETPQCMYVPSEVGSIPSEDTAAVLIKKYYNLFMHKIVRKLSNSHLCRRFPREGFILLSGIRHSIDYHFA